MKRYLLTIAISLCVAASALGADPQPSTKAERNLVRRGNELYAKQQYHQALQCYNDALALNPDYQYALYNKALALVQLGSDDNKDTQNDPRVEAAKIFAAVAQQNQVAELAARSYYNLGNLAFNNDKLDDAIEAYKNSLRIDSQSVQCRQNLLIALQKKEEQEQNQDQQQDQQDQQEQQQDQQDQQQDQQEQQQPQPQPQMTQSAEQLLQAMQNKENQTRRRANQQEPAGARRTTDKPW